ncbi:MAG: flagellar FliJ family protein [Planctomycetota bacterium]|nr:flagellar FliJ family protein [Planctomycetota bacterium]
MKRAFRFKLARVERVRGLFEETARAEFSTALAAVHAAEEHLDALRAEVLRGRSALAAAQLAGHLDARAHLARHEGLSCVIEAVVTAEAERARLAANAEELRLAWQARRADKLALTRMSERHKERHLAEVAKVELAELDEIAIQRAGRISPSSQGPGTPDRR